MRLGPLMDKYDGFIVTEGSGDTGNGNLDLIQAVYWRKFIKDNNLSYIVWNLSNANESAALIKTSCRKTGNWSFFDYSASGKFAGIMFRC